MGNIALKSYNLLHVLLFDLFIAAELLLELDWRNEYVALGCYMSLKFSLLSCIHLLHHQENFSMSKVYTFPTEDPVLTQVYIFL